MLGFKLKVFSFEIAIDEVKMVDFFYPHIIYCHKFGLVEAEKNMLNIMKTTKYNKTKRNSSHS